MRQAWTESRSTGLRAGGRAKRGRCQATALQIILIAIAAVVPYLNALSADFTFDDVDLIRDNVAIQIRPAAELLTYVYHPGGLYRPLTMLTYAANARVDRGPFGYHLVNVLLHALASLAVFFLVRRLVESPSVASVTALLFAVHPIHTEAVTGVVGRAELLAALGVLATLLAFLRARDSAGIRRRLWSAASLLAFAAAMLAKESAFTALGLIAVLHWWRERRAAAAPHGHALAQHLAVLAPYAVVAAAYLGLRLAVVGSLGVPEDIAVVDNPLAHADPATRVRTALIVLWQYMSLLTVPAQLSADYSFNQIPLAFGWDDPRFLATAACFLALALTAAAAVPRLPALAVAALLTAIPLALTANVFFPIGTIKGERLLYLPSLGWCFLLACLAAAAVRSHARATALALVALITFFGARTWMRNADWRDDTTLFAATVASSPDSAKANYNSAVVLQRAEELDEAMLYYRRALEILPDYASAAFGIGNIYRLKGVDAGALHWYEQALRLDPRDVSAHIEIALLHHRNGAYDAAEAAVLTGLEIDPNNPMLLVCQSAVQFSQGDEWRSRAALAQLDGIGTLDAHATEQVAAARQAIEAVLQ
jgi:protein O-mannosyl-transferase